jgi:hypothetical protein
MLSITEDTVPVVITEPPCEQVKFIGTVGMPTAFKASQLISPKYHASVEAASGNPFGFTPVRNWSAYRAGSAFVNVPVASPQAACCNSPA